MNIIVDGTSTILPVHRSNNILRILVAVTQKQKRRESINAALHSTCAICACMFLTFTFAPLRAV